MEVLVSSASPLCSLITPGFAVLLNAGNSLSYFNKSHSGHCFNTKLKSVVFSTLPNLFLCLCGNICIC